MYYNNLFTLIGGRFIHLKLKEEKHDFSVDVMPLYRIYDIKNVIIIYTFIIYIKKFLQGWAILMLPKNDLYFS